MMERFVLYSVLVILFTKLNGELNIILFYFISNYYVFTQHIFLISKQVFYMYNELRKMVSAILAS